MHLFKTVIKKDLALTKVLDFVPPKFELNTPEAALAYLEKKQRSETSFDMSEALRIQTGLDKLEEAAQADRIDEMVIEKLKEVQEDAYQQAYEMGMEEGRKYAFEQASTAIERRLNELDSVLKQISDLKQLLIEQNEAHLVKLTYYMASKIAMKQIDEHPELVVEIMKQAISLSQSEEEILVQVPSSQVDFLEQVKKETGRELEFLKKVKFEAHEDMSVGGCIILTNYGEVDARLEERIHKLWTSLQETLPKATDKVAS